MGQEKKMRQSNGKNIKKDAENKADGQMIGRRDGQIKGKREMEISNGVSDDRRRMGNEMVKKKE